jgi:hypothetical protein
MLRERRVRTVLPDGENRRMPRGDEGRILERAGLARRGRRAPAARTAGVAFVLALALVLALGAPSPVSAGTTGKLSGRIVDTAQKPVTFAAVMIVGTRLGSNTDAEGRYNIINVPPGVYDLTVNHLAYQPVTFKDVLVTVDNTTWQDVTLQPSVQNIGEVVIQAERPLIDVRVTSARSTVTADQIQQLPVQELQEVVNLQAGVVNGHFRGGRLGEVQYQVDGVSVNDPYTNKSSLSIDRSLLQEVQVISGVFDAEYGQAMSGVVNAVLKEGTDSLEWNAELYGGGFYFPDGTKRPVDHKDRVQLTGTGSAQASASGPLPLPRTTFLVSGRRNVWNDYVQARQLLRLVQPWIDDPSDPDAPKLPVFDGHRSVLGYSREWSGLLKITNTSLPGIKVSYQALVNQREGRHTNYAWVLNPDGLSKQRQVSIMHGLDWTHSLGASAFYNVSVRENYVDYKDMLYENLWDARYDYAGAPEQPPWIGNGALIAWGADQTRFIQKTNAAMVKGSFTSQVTRDQMIKFGGDVQWPSVVFGNPGYFGYKDGVLVRHYNEPPVYPGPKRYRPTIAAAYGQSQLEWNDFTIRTGLRLEHFNAHATLPSDLANPANAIQGAPISTLVAVKGKTVLSPRVAMAYPITQRAGIHFAYGHFTQYPSLNDIFTNADYAKLPWLQASTDIPVMGNPDIGAERTVQYELGYKQMLTNDLGASLNLFYKDIRGLLGVEFITTYNLAQYARLTNVDFGDVIGFTFSIDQRKFGKFSSTIDYTWQHAQGNSSEPRETATRAQAGEDSRPRLVPLNWDQRHTLNLTLQYDEPGAYSASGIVRVASGQPYTPILDRAYGYGMNANSGRKPVSLVVDLRGERFVRVADRRVSLFGRVFNLFDTRTVNGFVFESTGSADYSRFPVTDVNTLRDPTRYAAPRRVEAGLTLDSAW